MHTSLSKNCIYYSLKHCLLAFVKDHEISYKILYCFLHFIKFFVASQQVVRCYTNLTKFWQNKRRTYLPHFNFSHNSTLFVITTNHKVSNSANNVKVVMQQCLTQAHFITPNVRKMFSRVLSYSGTRIINFFFCKISKWQIKLVGVFCTDPFLV